MKCYLLTALFAWFACSATAVALPTDGLIAHYTFDDHNTTVAADASPMHHDGTIIGAITYADGISGKALCFPGRTDSYVSVPDPDKAFCTSGSLTLSAWVKRDDVGTNWDGIVCNGVGKGGYQLLYGDKDQNIILYLKTSQTGYKPVAGPYFPCHGWQHIAATYDSTRKTANLFINGNKAAAEPFKGAVTDFGKELLIGKSAYAGAFRGLIDEVRIYDRALAPDEIKALAAAFTPQNNDKLTSSPKFFESLTAERRDDCEGVSITLTLADDTLSRTHVMILRNKERNANVNPGTQTATCIFDGELTSKDGKHFVYFDRITKPDNGFTYYYWAKPDDDADIRVAPARVRFRDPRIWWSPNRIQDEITRIAEQYPDMAKLENVGYTVQGRPLNALCIGNRDRYIILIGATHVSESGPELIIPAVERMIKNAPDVLKKVGIVTLPCLTLDERQRLLSTGNPYYFRGNANGVDLNRNYDGYWEDPGNAYNKRSTNPKDQTYGGPAAFSEPETRAVRTITQTGKPLAAFSMHSVNGLTNGGFLYTDRIKQQPEQTKAFVDLARTYVIAMYGEEDTDKYAFFRPECVNGSMASWLYKQFGIPAYDIELDDNPKARRPAIDDTVTPELLDEFSRLHEKGLIAVLQKLAVQP